MALTPQDVQQKEFKQQFRGYNEVEVDAFLDEVELELTRLIAENEDLRQRLASVVTAQAAAAPGGEADEMLRRTLLLAQRTADETIAAARAEADRLLGEAQAQAEHTVVRADERARAALGDLDARRRQLEAHIEGLRAFEREYRARLRAYLEGQLRDLEGRAVETPASPPASPPPASPPPASPPRAVAAGVSPPPVEPSPPPAQPRVPLAAPVVTAPPEPPLPPTFAPIVAPAVPPRDDAG